MAAAFSASVLLITAQFAANKQLQQKALISQLLQTYITADAKNLSKQLRYAVDFEYLTITNTNNDVLYRYIKPTSEQSPISFILKQFDLYPSAQRLKTDKGNLIVEFQSAFVDLLTPLSVILLLAMFAPIMMMLLIYYVAQYVQDKRYEKLSAYLYQRLVAQEQASSLDKVKGVEHFNQLIEQLAQSDSKPQQAQTSYEQNIDPITGYSTMAQFQHFYQHKVKVSGRLILVRMSHIHALRISGNEQMANQYAQLIAKAIWQTFNFIEDCHTFRLNEQDFALLLFEPNVDLERLLEELVLLADSLTKQHRLRARLTTVNIAFERSLALTELLAQAEHKINNR